MVQKTLIKATIWQITQKTPEPVIRQTT